MICEECKKNRHYQDFKEGKKLYDVCLDCRLFPKPEIEEIKIPITKENIVIGEKYKIC